MFISLLISDANLVWRRFIHSLGRVSSPGQTDCLHTNRDRSSLVIESIIYDITLPLYGVRVLSNGVSNNIQNTMVIIMGLVRIIVFATKS